MLTLVVITARYYSKSTLCLLIAVLASRSVIYNTVATLNTLQPLIRQLSHLCTLLLVTLNINVIFKCSRETILRQKKLEAKTYFVDRELNVQES